MAHEIGHNLGMQHTFAKREDHVNIECRAEGTSTIKMCDQCANWNSRERLLIAQTEASGECCTGFMDYGDHPEYWSDCSVKGFEQHYVSRKWARCLPEVTGKTSFLP